MDVASLCSCARITHIQYTQFPSASCRPQDYSLYRLDHSLFPLHNVKNVRDKEEAQPLLWRSLIDGLEEQR